MKKKKITIKGYAQRSLVQSTLYFVALLAWQLNVFTYHSQELIPSWVLGFFLLAFILWCMCYFEIRTLTKHDERFLGYKGYILFFVKLLMFPIVAFVTPVIGAYTRLIVYPLLEICGVCSLYYICFTILLYPYRSYIRANAGELYVCYQRRVTKWYREGKIDV